MKVIKIYLRSEMQHLDKALTEALLDYEPVRQIVLETTGVQYLQYPYLEVVRNNLLSQYLTGEYGDHSNGTFDALTDSSDDLLCDLLDEVFLDWFSKTEKTTGYDLRYLYPWDEPTTDYIKDIKIHPYGALYLFY